MKGVCLWRTDATTEWGLVEDMAAPVPVGGPRGKITCLSYQSRQRLAWTAANSGVPLRSMLTVTYPAEWPGDGKEVKRHLRVLLQWLRRREGGAESYLWFLEFQARGAPHFHILTGAEIPQPWVALGRRGRAEPAQVNRVWQTDASEAWYGIVGSQDPKHLRAGTCWEALRCADAAGRYVAKETYKVRQKEVPERYQNVGRFWGASKDMAPVLQAFIICSEEDLTRSLAPGMVSRYGKPRRYLFGWGRTVRGPA